MRRGDRNLLSNRRLNHSRSHGGLRGDRNSEGTVVQRLGGIFRVNVREDVI